MSSAYGSLQAPNNPNIDKALSFLLPCSFALRDLETLVYVHRVPPVDNTSPTSSQCLYDTLHKMLNEEIRCGGSYPQEDEFSYDSFVSYFLSAEAFVVTTEEVVDPENCAHEILGTFYIKPNFPGRCSHICNGGFITVAAHRNKGVGRAMGEAFLMIAPVLGYSAAMFNLVFENNISSIRLWRSLGFQEIGRIPNAGRLNTSTKLVDAIMFYYEFAKPSSGALQTIDDTDKASDAAQDLSVEADN